MSDFALVECLVNFNLYAVYAYLCVKLLLYDNTIT